MLVVLALAGCFICIVLIRLATPTGRPAEIWGMTVCAPTTAVNCDYVLNSRWARLGPIPTSVAGLAYFGLLALWYGAIGLPNRAGRRWHLLPLLAVLAGASCSAGLLYVLAFRLPVWCTWCVAAHVVNFWILIFTLLAWPRRREVYGEPVIAPQTRYPSGSRVAAVLGFAVAVLWIMVATLTAYNSQAYARQLQGLYLKAVNNADYIQWRYQQAPVRDIPIRPDDPSLGSGEAPSTLVVFSDFQCPKCRAFHRFLDSLLARFPGKLRCVYKHCPMARECNPQVSQTLHYFSCGAAEAAEAARAVASPEQVEAYFGRLFDRLARLEEYPYEVIAAEVGIDRGQFAAALRAGLGRERVQEDAALAHDLGVSGTPAVFLNGRLLPSWQILKSDLSPGEPAMDADATMVLWEKLLAMDQHAPSEMAADAN
jgi:protein-disulfide isomerase/uncharacterized membrane protein